MLLLQLSDGDIQGYMIASSLQEVLDCCPRVASLLLIAGCTYRPNAHVYAPEHSSRALSGAYGHHQNLARLPAAQAQGGTLVFRV